MRPDISVIIPVLNEQNHINKTLQQLAGQLFDGALEIIVVDGNPGGSTIRCITDPDVKTMVSGKGRGCQMNAGAEAASAGVLLFLHCDTQLPKGGLDAVKRTMTNPVICAGAFDLKIDANGLAFRMIEKSTSLRSRLTRVPYGDQAIFIKKSWFFNINGFKNIPIMEDVDLMQRIKKRRGNIIILNKATLTSARRWQKEGSFSATLRNWSIRVLYLAGVSPQRLAKLYPDN